MKISFLFTFVFFICAYVAQSEEGDVSKEKVLNFEETIVYGKKSNLIGEAISASEGVIGEEEIEIRPMLRVGEVLEFIPGMIVTQHSGSGKANQYFLRGFNLDHGTDFSTSIDGMPVNMRTHGHGQGYTDINFLIPELVQYIDYKKGVYYSEVGDFSSAGAVELKIKNEIENPAVGFEIGEDNFGRFLAYGDASVNSGRIIYGVEHNMYDGPWTDIHEDINKLNGLLRYVSGDESDNYSITFMGYDNSWNSADQIPSRAVASGQIDELGSIDRSVGGDSHRFSLSGSLIKDDFEVSSYIIDYEMNLWSNFTYFLDDPVAGDQFQQVDDRHIIGTEVIKKFKSNILSHPIENKMGFQFRFDKIDEVSLNRTNQRVRTGVVRSDEVDEWSMGLFTNSKIPLSDKLTGEIGFRFDYFDVDVTSDLPTNSGSDSDEIISLKLGLMYLLNDHWEAYVNAGQGFHSNDARGATIKVDPLTNASAEKVDLLVQSEGAEVGIRFFQREKLNVSLAAWVLNLDSELVFVGDAGNTEASRPSRRYGYELTTYYWLNRNISLDLEIAMTKSKFTEPEIGEGNHIDGSIPLVSSAGISYLNDKGIYGAIRARYFGKRPLDSFRIIESDTTTVVNMNFGYKVKKWNFGLDILNLFDSNDHDIDYFYSSRLNGEPVAGIDDIHFHPIEPLTFRLNVNYQL